MKYNLIPKERQKSVCALPQRGYAVSAVILGTACMLSWAAGILLQDWADTEQTRFMTQSLPRQQRILKENAAEKKLKQRADEIAAQEKKRIHWAPILVMLAKTKPETLDIERLEVRQRRFIVYGSETTEQADLQKWQDRLRREPMVKRVFASQKRERKAGEIPVFQVEVELAHEEIADTAVPTS